MRSQKHNVAVDPGGATFLTPMVHRYKLLHLAAVKSLVPERGGGLQRTADPDDDDDDDEAVLGLCDPTAERHANTSLTSYFSKPDKRFARSRRRLDTPPVLLLAGDCLDPAVSTLSPDASE
ncbi:hypothetical protein CRUP_025590, partial [Coryphaenoides rupestris]